MAGWHDQPRPEPSSFAEAGRAVDPGVLHRLTLDLGGAEVRELCALFVADAPAKAREVGAGLAGRDRERAAAIAHSLKSASALVGARSLSDLCAEIERLARQGRLRQARRRTGELERLAGAAAAELSAFVSEGRAR